MENIIRKILDSKSRREVIKCLCPIKTELSGREMARRTGFSHQQIHNALRQLMALGIVQRRIIGPLHLFRINREDRVAAEVVRKFLSGAAGEKFVSGKVSGEKHKACWHKAMEFFDAMPRAGKSGDWCTAGLAGIYCCLFAACAVLVKRTGSFPDMASPQSIPALLVAEIGARGITGEIANLKTILSHKQRIDHASRPYSENEAVALEAGVKRYMGWIEGVYNSLPGGIKVTQNLIPRESSGSDWISQKD